MRRHALFAGLLVIFAGARFAILLTSQTHVHSDEAIIGLMGKHILEGRYFPFYMYGQAYNAGAAWEAYLAAIAFAFFGVGVISLKSCIVLLSLLCLFLFYRMCLALYDQTYCPFGHHRVCAHSVTSQVALPGKRLFLVFSFHSSANDSLGIDSIDAQSKMVTISFVWCYFGLEHMEFGTGNRV